jgi:hypothetical protein
MPAISTSASRCPALPVCRMRNPTWCCGAGGPLTTQTASPASSQWVPCWIRGCQCWQATCRQCASPLCSLPGGVVALTTRKCRAKQALPPAALWLPSSFAPHLSRAAATADAAAGPLQRPAWPPAFLLHRAGKWREKALLACPAKPWHAALLLLWQLHFIEYRMQTIPLLPSFPFPCQCRPAPTPRCPLCCYTSSLACHCSGIMLSRQAQYTRAAVDTVAAAACLHARPVVTAYLPPVPLLPVFASLPATHPSAPFT